MIGCWILRRSNHLGKPGGARVGWGLGRGGGGDLGLVDGSVGW